MGIGHIPYYPVIAPNSSLAHLSHILHGFPATMTPEEIRELYVSGVLHVDESGDDDPDYEVEEDDMYGDIFEEEDDFHGKYFLMVALMVNPPTYTLCRRRGRRRG